MTKKTDDLPTYTWVLGALIVVVLGVLAWMSGGGG